ncbi:hypothetical protein B0J13DRAFT_74680 [Dactylonectria estremocensis]|uniref:Uncharacterized protein n=1 Tax=Dactylonectria estremocensis TaxID=1079267 RepID=A0A9P9EHI7_9HYPO|nr:hypothetical protein B0J13DRAFT_74680 [Dactylonectria estremocensis]
MLVAAYPPSCHQTRDQCQEQATAQQACRGQTHSRATTSSCSHEVPSSPAICQRGRAGRPREESIVSGESIDRQCGGMSLKADALSCANTSSTSEHRMPTPQQVSVGDCIREAESKWLQGEPWGDHGTTCMFARSTASVGSASTTVGPSPRSATPGRKHGVPLLSLSQSVFSSMLASCVTQDTAFVRGGSGHVFAWLANGAEIHGPFWWHGARLE